MKTVAFHTLGCKLNYAESSALGRQFIAQGFSRVELDAQPDVFVLNTCSVTENADREARQIIRRARRASPDAVIVVTGCYAQLRPEDVAAIEGVDLVLGASEKFRLFEYLPHDLRRSGAPRIACAPIDEATTFGPSFSSEHDSRTRAFLKVQDGCDYTCAFCTIPLARGASRSQSIQDTAAQAHELASRGFKEIVLTGVNVGDFGNTGGGDLLELLKSLEHVDGIERYRISSIEPNLFTAELREFVSQSDKIAPHFHIPLQSGSDTILRSMRRRYLSAQYRELVEELSACNPDAAIGVDVIVGFPGETDALFQETVDFLESLPIAYLHVFTYSERDQTVAVSLPGRVDIAVRKHRNAVLRSLSAKKRYAFTEANLGTLRKVLIEQIRDDGMMEGWTENYIPVRMPAVAGMENMLVDVLLTDADGEGCMGEIMALSPDAHLSHICA